MSYYTGSNAYSTSLTPAYSGVPPEMKHNYSDTSSSSGPTNDIHRSFSSDSVRSSTSSLDWPNHASLSADSLTMEGEAKNALFICSYHDTEDQNTRCACQYAREDMVHRLKYQNHVVQEDPDLQNPNRMMVFRPSDRKTLHMSRINPSGIHQTDRELVLGGDDDDFIDFTTPSAKPNFESPLFEHANHTIEALIHGRPVNEVVKALNVLNQVVSLLNMQSPNHQTTKGIVRAWRILQQSYRTIFASTPNEGPNDTDLSDQPRSSYNSPSSVVTPGMPGSITNHNYPLEQGRRSRGERASYKNGFAHSKSQKSARSFACPVAKYYALQGQQVCNYEGATGLSTIADHLRQNRHRLHVTPFSRCNVCWGFYAEEQGGCDNLLHGDLQNGQRGIQPRGQNQELAWVALYLFLYPGASPVPSPYVGDNRFVDITQNPGSNAGTVDFVTSNLNAVQDQGQDVLHGEPPIQLPTPSLSPATPGYGQYQNLEELHTSAGLSAIAAELLQGFQSYFDMGSEYASRYIHSSNVPITADEQSIMASHIWNTANQFAQRHINDLNTRVVPNTPMDRDEDGIYEWSAQ